MIEWSSLIPYIQWCLFPNLYHSLQHQNGNTLAPIQRHPSMPKLTIYRCNFLFLHVYHIIGLLVITDSLSTPPYKHPNMCDILFLSPYTIILTAIHTFANNVFILLHSYTKGHRIICKWGDREAYPPYHADNRPR